MTVRRRELRRLIAALERRPTVITEHRDPQGVYERAKQLETQYRQSNADRPYRPKPSRLARALAWLVAAYAITSTLRFPPRSR